MLAGVASGLARYAGMDPTIVRVCFVIAVVFTGGTALLAYPVLWLLIPQEPASSPWPAPTDVPPTGTQIPTDVPTAPPPSVVPTPSDISPPTTGTPAAGEPPRKG